MVGRGLSLEISFWGYTPGCFPKSGDVVENVGVAGGVKSRVRKALYLKEFEVGVIRTWVGGRFMSQDSTELYVCQYILDSTVRIARRVIRTGGLELVLG